MRYVVLTDDVSEEEFTRFMRRDLKKIYDEKVAECTKQKRCSADVKGFTNERSETVGNRD